LESPVRQAQLKILVEGSEAAIELALAQADEPEVRYLGWMITKILGDDFETNGSGEVQIAEDTAADRIIRLDDPEMRHGRKSAAPNSAATKRPPVGIRNYE
jgi:hypothetical protein